jgi:hypothetical protein
MESLARAGVRAGVDLRVEEGLIRFDHYLVMLALEKP